MMHAYTVEITERNVVFVPAARTAADAQRQAEAWIAVHASGDVSVSGVAQPIQPNAKADACLLADTAITEA